MLARRPLQITLPVLMSTAFRSPCLRLVCRVKSMYHKAQLYASTNMRLYKVSRKLCLFPENFQCKISLKPPENGQPITVEFYTHILQTKVRQSNAKKNNGEPCMHTKWPLTRRHCALFLERGEGWILRLHDIGSGGGIGREGEEGGRFPEGEELT